LRDVLIAELNGLDADERLIAWAQQRLPSKNALTTDDARIVEANYRTVLERVSSTGKSMGRDDLLLIDSEAANEDDKAHLSHNTDRQVIPLQKAVRRRSKVHLAFVRAQPCVVCQRQPCDAHHLRFAQGRALGRKVSDEFTVPLCRDHHNELHRHGNEMAWWANLKILPVEAAGRLWETSPAQVPSTAVNGQGHLAEPANSSVQS
jgi:hypothetical protein